MDTAVMFHRSTRQEARLVIQGCSLHKRKESHIQQGEKTSVSQGNKGSESQGKVWQGHPREFKMPFLRAHTWLQKLTHYCQAPVIINCECNLIKSNKLSPSLSDLNCPSQGRAQRRDANRHLSLPTAHSQTVLMGGWGVVFTNDALKSSHQQSASFRPSKWDFPYTALTK